MKLWVLKVINLNFEQLKKIAQKRGWTETYNGNRLTGWEEFDDQPYDRTNGFVLIAGTELDARKIAQNNSDNYIGNIWLDVDFTTCIEIDEKYMIDNANSIVLEDYINN